LRTRIPWLLLALIACGDAPQATSAEPEVALEASTPVLTREGEAFLLDAEPIAPFGLRAVNALQSDAIANRLIAQLGLLRAHGIQSVVVGLQGGRHTEGGNSAFNAFDARGGLAPDYAARLARLLDATAAAGIVPVINFFYRGRDQELTDDEAVRTAVRESLVFLRPWRHAWVQVINEPNHRGFDRHILTSPEGQAELYRVAKEADPGRLVYVSHEPGAHDGFLADTWGRVPGVTPPEPGNVAIEYLRGDRYDAPGVFSRSDRDAAVRHASETVSRGGYWFWHAAWHQKADAPGWPRFDPGGAGTQADPGVSFAWEAMRALLPPR
jgi:hypothetical protein